MRRRTVLAGMVGGTAMAAVAAVGSRRIGFGANNVGPDGTGTDEAETDEPRTEEAGHGETEPPFSLAALWPDGDGSITVPPDGAIGVVAFARTNCPTARDHLAAVADAADRIENEPVSEEVRFIGVVQTTRDPASTSEEFVSWWDETAATWPLGLDETGAAFDYYDATSPTTVYVDTRGTEVDRDAGSISADSITNTIRTVGGD